ncbi:hypothetical protein FACS1894192_08190 [Bacilli bacterium]|nr:hypothetical protein FACS1894192_08190 [Bacilli bacterium]
MCEKRIVLAVKGEQAEWLDNQNNATAALRTLIQVVINKFGTADLFVASLESAGIFEGTPLVTVDKNERGEQKLSTSTTFEYSKDVEVKLPDNYQSQTSVSDNDKDINAMLGLN